MTHPYGSAVQSMEPEHLLDFAGEILAQLGEARPVNRRNAHAGRDAGWWDLPVKGSRKAVDLIRAYAAAQNTLIMKLNEIQVGSVSLSDQSWLVRSDGVEVFLKYKLFDAKPETKRIFAKFPSIRVAALCRGGWVDLNVARVRMGSLIPLIRMDGDTVVMSWGSPPQVELGSKGILGLGLFRRWTQTTLKEFRIGPDYGEFVADGLVDWVLPRLKWPAATV